MLAILCPGQGAQKPGMLLPWLDDSPTAALLQDWSAEIDLDLTALGSTADAATIQDTAVAQPLLTAATLASFRALLALAPQDATVQVAAGHSVGELGAAAVAGVLSDVDAMRLVAERGRAMTQAAAATPTGMSAVVGGKDDEVMAAIEAAGLTAANINGGGQVVAAGTAEQLQALADAPPARARVIPLSVAGAFHTEHMAPAVARVQAAVAEIDAHDPTLTLLSNRDGQAVGTGTEALARIAGQVANPVRWDLCCESMLQLGVTGAIELCPGGVLTGLAKRTLKGVETLAVTSPEDLPDAVDMLARHGGTR